MIDRLVEGTIRFREKIFPTKKALYEKLAKGQSPNTLFITCSDSRVVPHLLTGSEPGDLFVIRNAGNFVPPPDVDSGEGATLDYAVCALKVRDIVVCGHAQCGAVGALYDPAIEQKLPSVARWIKFGRKAQEIVRAEGEPDSPQERIRAAIQANVRVQLAHLAAFPSVQDGLKNGSLALHGWVYQFESGDVLSLDPKTNRFHPLGESF